MAYLTAVGLNFGRYAVCPLVISMAYTYPEISFFPALQCPGTDLRSPDLGPSEAFRACLGPGIALEWLWGAPMVLGRPGGHFFKKELFGQWTSLRWSPRQEKPLFNIGL